MNKLTSSGYMARTIVLSSFMASVGSPLLPLPSMADEQKFYRNCAQLQKHLNDNNPELTVKGFEKAKMIRRDLNAEKYIVFCNGGIITDRNEGTICRGYIAYSYARIVAGADHYARWGKTNGLPNLYDTGKENYCRWLK